TDRPLIITPPPYLNGLTLSYLACFPSTENPSRTLPESLMAVSARLYGHVINLLLGCSYSPWSYTGQSSGFYFPSTENPSRTFPGIPFCTYPELTKSIPPLMAGPPTFR